MIATESDTDESSLSSDDSLVNSIIEENIIVEEKMNVSYVTKPEHSNIYLNEKKDECLICYKELKNNVVCINNNYCKCFFNVLLCDVCFFNWFIRNNRCFICRKSFRVNPQNQFKLYKFGERLLLMKLIEKMFKNTKSENKFKIDMNITIPFSVNNLQEPLRQVNQESTQELTEIRVPTFPLREGLSRTLQRPPTPHPSRNLQINNRRSRVVDDNNTHSCNCNNLTKIEIFLLLFTSFFLGITSYFVVVLL